MVVNRGAKASAAASRRRMEARDSGLHPTTSERQYEPDELEFLAAVQAYQNRTGRKFPTYCELLGILKDLGYAKLARPD